jgi:hypothetical protein
VSVGNGDQGAAGGGEEGAEFICGFHGAWKLDVGCYGLLDKMGMDRDHSTCGDAGA